MTGGPDYARVAAQAIRALCHATRGGDGYRHPADVDATIGELEALAGMLPQALDQAEQWLTDEAAAGRVAHDTNPRDDALGVIAVGALSLALDDARDHAHTLTTSLAAARRITARLAATDTPGEQT